MKLKNKWALLNSIVLSVWLSFSLIVLHLFNVQVFIYPTEFDFYTMYKFVLFPFSIVAITLAYHKKLRFQIYTILCLLWGLGSIFANDYVFGIIIFLTSIIFFYRLKPKLFTNKNFIICTSVIEVLFCCLIIFIREPSLKTLIFLSSKFVAFLVLLSLYLYALFPAYLKRVENTKPRLDCSKFNYSKEQKLMLSKVLAGEKYSALSKEFEMSISMVKKHVKAYCKDLQVIDKTMLLAKYANYIII